MLLCLPAYNEEQTLPPLIESCAAVLAAVPLEKRIIIVNDGSSDGTGAMLAAAGAKFPLLQVVTHERNRGLGPAILTGLQEAVRLAQADADAIICMDADNTHPPDVIPLMLEKLAGGADIVIASRYRRGSRQVGVPLFRRLLSLGGRIVFTLKLGLPGVRDYTCGYRAYRASVVRRGLEQYGEQLISRPGFACTDELLVKLAPFCRRIEEVPFVLRYDRKIGRSKLPIWTTIKATLALLFRKE